jgi:hypothetical protein
MEILDGCNKPPNNRMQTDHPIRYANGLAADARRYMS